MGLLAGAVDENKAFGDDDVRSGNPRIVGKESEQYFKATRAFLSYAEELGKPPAELAINWLLSHRCLLSVISGARNASEAIANARAFLAQALGDVAGTDLTDAPNEACLIHHCTSPHDCGTEYELPANEIGQGPMGHFDALRDPS